MPNKNALEKLSWFPKSFSIFLILEKIQREKPNLIG
jgi:hypothetical protein